MTEGFSTRQKVRKGLLKPEEALNRALKEWKLSIDHPLVKWLKRRIKNG